MGRREGPTVPIQPLTHIPQEKVQLLKCTSSHIQAERQSLTERSHLAFATGKTLMEGQREGRRDDPICKSLINQIAFNQSINHSINQSINQSTNQLNHSLCHNFFQISFSMVKVLHSFLSTLCTETHTHTKLQCTLKKW